MLELQIEMTFTDWIFLVLMQDLAVAAVHVGHVYGVSIGPVHFPAKTPQHELCDTAPITDTRPRMALYFTLYMHQTFRYVNSLR